MSVEDFMIPCPTKRLFGIDCLGCGFQRALLMLFKGDFSAAWQLYPPLFPILPLAVVFFLYLTDKNHDYRKVLKLLGIINAIFIPASYIYRHFIQ